MGITETFRCQMLPQRVPWVLTAEVRRNQLGRICQLEIWTYVAPDCAGSRSLGCQLRNISRNQLRPLCAQGKTLVARQAPLELANLCAVVAACVVRH